MIAPRVVIRADGGPGVGLGHVRRGLALAEALRSRRIGVTVVIPDHPALRATVVGAGFPVEAVPAADAATLASTRALAVRLGAGAVVVDSYTVSGDALRPPLAPVTAVVDDLGDRELPVDLVISGSAYGERLSYRVPAHTVVLAGLPYVMLRPEFATAGWRPVRRQVERVLVTVGGGDAQGLSPMLVRAVTRAVPTAEVDAVLGPLAPAELDAATAALGARVHVHRPTGAMLNLMEAADIAVSGGGQTVYELAAMGVPAVAVELADNQHGNLEALAALGTLVAAGNCDKDGLGGRVERLVRELAGDVGRRGAMVVAGRGAVDGRGAARVADALVARMAAVGSITS